MGVDDLGLGPAILSLVSPTGTGLRPIPLTPSSPKECSELAALRSMSDGELLDRQPLRSTEDGRCVRAGLLLYFSALDESHRISQGIRSPNASYWHGIMHRLEGDWSNAKYWFRSTGDHPVFADMALAAGGGWDPYDFVDRCETASSTGTGAERLVDLQMAEWRLLMGHCCRAALGS